MADFASVQEREDAAVAAGTRYAFAGLQTTAAAATAGTEVTGTGYARQPLTWAAGTVDGVATASATFTVPANVTVASAFLTTAVTAGTFRRAVDAAYAAQTISGTLVVNFTYTQTA